MHTMLHLILSFIGTSRGSDTVNVYAVHYIQVFCPASIVCIIVPKMYHGPLSRYVSLAN